MALQINPNEVIRLIQFLGKHGVSNPNDYRFEIDPSFRPPLNLKIDLIVTHLKPPTEQIRIVLDP